MGIGSALAIGFLQGRTEKAAREAEQRAEEAKARQEEEMSLFETVMGMEGFDPNSAEGQKFLKSFDNKKIQALAGISFSMNNAENNLYFGSGQNSFYIPKADMKNKSGMFYQAEAHLDNLNQWLMNEDNFNAATLGITNNSTTRNALFNYIARYENQYLEGYNIEQRKNQELGENEIGHTSIQQFGNIMRLADLYDDEEKQESKDTFDFSVDFYNEKTNTAYFEVRKNSDQQPVTMGMKLSENEGAALQSLASRIGISTDDLVQSFYDTAYYKDLSEDPYAGMSPQQIVDSQYATFRNVLKLENEGFGELMANPLSMGIEKRRELGDKLRNMFGNDRYRMATAMSYLVSTPEYFKESGTPDNRYFSKPQKITNMTKNGRQFLKDEMKYTDKEIQAIQDGYRYSMETVTMLDQLAELEATELSDTTGFARVLERIVLGAGEQIKQVTGLADDLFGKNDVFTGNLKGNDVNSDSLGNIAVAMVKSGQLQLQDGTEIKDGKLVNISKVDALKLALAARMARAIDPSGRLSNQDFEIQLSRLGNALLSSPETIQGQLALLRDEFTANLERNTVLNAITKPGATIDAKTARSIVADGIIEDALYGSGSYTQSVTAGSFTEVEEPPQVEYLPELDGVVEPIAKTNDGLDILGVVNEDGDESFWVFEEGKGYRPFDFKIDSIQE